MLAFVLATALADPTVDLSAGLGVFSPLKRPWLLGPAVEGQVDVGGLLDPVPQLEATGQIELGFFPGVYCSGCQSYGVFRIGLGPTWSTEWVDATVLARAVGNGPNIQIRPAIQANANLPGPGPTTVHPYLGLDGLRFVDLYAGVRVGTTVAGGTRERPRQCEDGELRTLDEPVASGQIRGIGDVGVDDIEIVYTHEYSNALENPLGEWKNNVGAGLAILGGLQSAHNLKSGEAGINDALGRGQDIAGMNGWDWAIPLSAADLPGALATVELEIGRRAIDALLPKLEAHREQVMTGMRIHYSMDTTTFECVPQQRCEGGWWTDDGWVLRGEPVTTTRSGLDKLLLTPTGRSTKRGQLLGLWTMVSRFYNQRHPGTAELVHGLENPCGVSDLFTTDLEVEAGPSQEDCEGWLAERAGLDSERRALVGSYLDLHADQLEWAESQASLDCKEAEASRDFARESASKQAEIARLSGDAQSAAYAQDAQVHADEAAARATQKCEWASSVKERLGESREAVEARPGRLEEIEAEKAALDEKIATCNLIE